MLANIALHHSPLAPYRGNRSRKLFYPHLGDKGGRVLITFAFLIICSITSREKSSPVIQLMSCSRQEALVICFISPSMLTIRFRRMRSKKSIPGSRLGKMYNVYGDLKNLRKEMYF